MVAITTEAFVLVEVNVANRDVTRVFTSSDPDAIDALKESLELENGGFFEYTFRKAEAAQIPQVAR
jgi:hypothetical protein